MVSNVWVEFTVTAHCRIPALLDYVTARALLPARQQRWTKLVLSLVMFICLCVCVCVSVQQLRHYRSDVDITRYKYVLRRSLNWLQFCDIIVSSIFDLENYFFIFFSNKLLLITWKLLVLCKWIKVGSGVLYRQFWGETCLQFGDRIRQPSALPMQLLDYVTSCC